MLDAPDSCSDCKKLVELQGQLHAVVRSAGRGAPLCWVSPWPDLDPHLKIMIAGEEYLFPSWMVTAARQRSIDYNKQKDQPNTKT